ncbi:MAG: DUF885 domain-containing protein [Chitinophagaceae bacterium]
MKKLILFLLLPLGVFAQDGVKSPAIKAVLNSLDSFNRKQYDVNYPLGRYREEDFKKRYDFRKKIDGELNKIQKSTLDSNDLVTLELLKFTNANELAEYEFKAYLNPILSDDGFHIDFVGQSGTVIRTKQDAENYLKTLNAFPLYVDENIALIRKGISLGISQPAVVVEGFKSSYNNHIVDTVEKSMFYKPFLTKPAAISDADWAQYQEKGKKAVKEIVVPQYLRIRKFFEEEYVANTRKTLGATAFPDGQRYYQQRINYFTTTNISYEDVYQTGLKEVARIEAEMGEVMKEVGFRGSLKEFIQQLRNDDRFYVTTPDALLKEASFIAKKIDWTLPKFFGKLPRQPYGVQPVPAFLAPGYTGGRYSPASIRSGRAGEYWVNTYNLRSRPLYILESLTLHEAVPGHHLQMALNQEVENVPAFRKNLYLSAYGEGWALYCEYLGTEMGFFEDPYSRFGKLTYEMWRACRLVIDVGIHAKGWTQQQAVDYLADHTALSLHEVNTEVVRYIAWPGQAVSYKIGELKIRELRKKAEAALGPKFDLRAFHDMILSRGTVTLGILETMTNAFILANSK